MTKEINNKVIFIAVNYNGSIDTIKFIESINNLTTNKSTNCQVIIVDNNSSDADKQSIKDCISSFSYIQLLELNDNIGYFPAFNEGLAYIENDLQATVVLCNNDLIFEKDFLQNYLANTYNDDVFVVAPNVITLNGVHQNPHLISKISIKRKILNEIYFSHYYAAKLLKAISGSLGKLRKQNKKTNSKNSQYIHMGIGACYILRPVFFQHIKKLDDRIFLGGEEALLAGQLAKTPGKIYYDSSLIVHHAEGVSFSKMSTRWRYEISKKSYSIYKEYL